MVGFNSDGEVRFDAYYVIIHDYVDVGVCDLFILFNKEWSGR